MTNIYVDLVETKELVSNLKTELQNFEKFEEKLQHCVDIIEEQSSPKVISKFLEETKKLKTALAAFEEDKVKNNIELIEQAISNYEETDTTAKSKVEAEDATTQSSNTSQNYTSKYNYNDGGYNGMEY